MIEIYTDGSCTKGTGGWAFVILEEGNPIRSGSGTDEDTTNNRMEVTAVLEALQTFKPGSLQQITVRTDSQYVIGGMSGWNMVANQDLWGEMKNVANGLNIEWKWVKGHAGNEWNEVVDKMAKGYKN